MRAPPPYFLIGKSCPLALHEDKCFLKLALTGRQWRLGPRGSLLPSLCENSVQLSRTASFYPCLLVLVPQLPTPSEAHAHRQANRHLLIPVVRCPLPQSYFLSAESHFPWVYTLDTHNRNQVRCLGSDTPLHFRGCQTEQRDLHTCGFHGIKSNRTR